MPSDMKNKVKAKLSGKDYQNNNSQTQKATTVTTKDVEKYKSMPAMGNMSPETVVTTTQKKPVAASESSVEPGLAPGSVDTSRAWMAGAIDDNVRKSKPVPGGPLEMMVPFGAMGADMNTNVQWIPASEAQAFAAANPNLGLMTPGNTTEAMTQFDGTVDPRAEAYNYAIQEQNLRNRLYQMLGGKSRPTMQSDATPLAE